MKVVDVYWSHQSPYCYFVLDRILALQRRPDVEVILRTVHPGVLRIPEVFADTPNIEQRYFTRDVHRTAEFPAYPTPRPTLIRWSFDPILCLPRHGPNPVSIVFTI